MKIYKVHFLYFVANQPISFAERTFIIFIFFEKMMFKNLLVFWDTVRLFKLLLIDSLYISIIYKYNKKNQKWYFFEFFFVGKIGLEPITWYTTLQKCLLYVPFARSVCIKHLFYPLNYFPLVEEERFEQPVVVIPQWFRNQHIKPLCHISNKRRGRDSNPRDPFESADLANRYLKPLGHLSEIVAIHDLQPRPDCRLKLQRCRLITLHGRCYLPGKFSTFPISSVGGERGIRTPGGCYTPTIFKTAAFNHSATSPNHKVHLLIWPKQNNFIFAVWTFISLLL